MKNIIGILWQFETENIVINPTILKNQQESARFYFYSGKQHRVLRKKNSHLNQKEKIETKDNIFESNTNFIKKFVKEHLKKQAEQNHLNDRQQFLEGFVLMITKKIHNVKKKMSLKFLTLPQFMDWVSNSKSSGHCSLFKNHEKIVRVKFVVAEVRIQSLEIIDIFSLSSDNFFICKEKYGQKIKEWGIKMVQNLLKSLKNKEGKKENIHMNEFEFKIDSLISITPQQINFQQHNNNTIIRIIDLVKFQCSKNSKQFNFASLIDITFDYEINQQQILQKQQGFEVRTLQKNKNEQKQIEQVLIQNFAYDQNKQQCKGCSRQVSIIQCKEISSEQIRLLRKKYGLSLRGLTQEYYNVCQQCYKNHS